MVTGGRRDPGAVALMAAILEGTVDLAGAACAGRPELFDAGDFDEDDADVDYRHHHAVTLCASCPVSARCEEWSGGKRISMVTAGRRPPKAGRPRSEGDAA